MESKWKFGIWNNELQDYVKPVDVFGSNPILEQDIKPVKPAYVLETTLDEDCQPVDNPILYENVKPVDNPNLYESVKPVDNPILYESVKPVEVLQTNPILNEDRKVFDESINYPVDFLFQNSENTTENMEVVEENFKTEVQDIQYFCSFCSQNWKTVDQFVNHKCHDYS